MPDVCDRGELPIPTDDHAATHQHHPAVGCSRSEPRSTFSVRAQDNVRWSGAGMWRTRYRPGQYEHFSSIACCRCAVERSCPSSFWLPGFCDRSCHHEEGVGVPPSLRSRDRWVVSGSPDCLANSQMLT